MWGWSTHWNCWHLSFTLILAHYLIYMEICVLRSLASVNQSLNNGLKDKRSSTALSDLYIQCKFVLLVCISCQKLNQSGFGCEDFLTWAFTCTCCTKLFPGNYNIAKNRYGYAVLIWMLYNPGRVFIVLTQCNCRVIIWKSV